MIPQLREPFFLRGRRSIVQRAVVISLVLGAVSYFAGTAYGVCMSVAMSRPVDLVSSDWLLLTHAAVALFVLLPVGSLYCFWSGSDRSGIAIRMLGLAGILVIPCLSLQPASWYAAGDRWLTESTLILFIAQSNLSKLCPLMWAAWSLACFRLTRVWLLTSVLSLMSARLSVGWFFSLAPLLEPFGLRLAGILGGDLLFLVFGTGLLYGQYFAALMIPWGIPFWFPPKVTDQRPVIA